MDNVLWIFPNADSCNTVNINVFYIFTLSHPLIKVRQGINDLSTRILGANFVIQGAIPKILSETPKEWFDENMRYIEVSKLVL